MKTFFLSLTVLLAASAKSQVLIGPPAPRAAAPLHLDFIDRDAYFAALTPGAGRGSDGVHATPTGQFAAAVGLSTLMGNRGYSGVQEFVEVGVLGPLPDRAGPAAFFSVNFALNQVFTRDPHHVFFVTGGYSYVFSEGNAINFGVGADHFYRENRAIRFEVRDYFVFTQRAQSNLALRVGWVFSMPDP